MTRQRSIFDDRISEERARETLRKHGFLTAEEQAKRERESRAEREPLPYVETPEELKIQRMETLRRRLAGVDFYGKAEE